MSKFHLRFPSPLFIFLCIVCMVLMILLLYYVPLRTQFNVTFNMVEVHEGRILDEGQAVIEAEWLNYILRDDVLRYSNLQILDISVSDSFLGNVYPSMHILSHSDGRYSLRGVHTISYDGSIIIQEVIILLSPQRDSCIIRYSCGDLTRVFYGCQGEEIDLEAIEKAVNGNNS